jgi:hypothetical protein
MIKPQLIGQFKNIVYTAMYILLFHEWTNANGSMNESAIETIHISSSHLISSFIRKAKNKNLFSLVDCVGERKNKKNVQRFRKFLSPLLFIAITLRLALSYHLDLPWYTIRRRPINFPSRKVASWCRLRITHSFKF